MHVLLESRATAAPRRGSTMVSVMTHASLITAAVVATTSNGPVPIAAPPRTEVVYFTPPPPPAPSPGTPGASSAPPRGGLTFDPPVLDDSFPRVPPGPIDFTPSTIDPSVASEIGSSGFSPGATRPSGDGIFHENAVDRAVSPRPGNPAPAYPDQLRSSGLQGTVIVRFVVDTSGAVEPSSVTILETTHAAFAAAVRAWLPRTRYVAAELAGRRVRQLVQQRVEFQLR